ncbi:MAG: DUF4339 domain-containing protein [Planctomycetaceae bacterium]|nr:DUF4339 domain-containing protein [Planctomycetaceae bacterium]
MANRSWWVQTENQILGPISSARLRQLAAHRTIDPDTLISHDQVHWLPARKLRGLFPETGESAASLSAPDNPGRVEGSAQPRRKESKQRQDATTLKFDRLLPLIRLRRSFWKSEVLALYDSHLIHGVRFFTEFPLTEEMCQPSGEDALTGLCHRVRRINYEDVENVREHVPTGDQIRSHVFDFKGPHKGLKFSLISDQVGHVRAHLTKRLRDRYQWRQGRWSSWNPGVPPKKPVGQGDRDSSRRAPAAGETVKQPSRSAGLGWTFKVIGVLYWVATLSPLFNVVYQSLNPSGQSTPDLYIGMLLWLPVPLLIYAGYQLCQKPFCPVAARNDRRQPILFLRPFADDARISLQPGGTIAMFAGLRGSRHGIFHAGWEDSTGTVDIVNTLLAASPVRLFRMVFDCDVATSEETLVRFFEQHGPVNAIGKPGENLTTPGARRKYVSDASWQEHVLQMLSESQAIVIQPGRSEGVLWELKHIRQRVSPERVLLCLVSFWRQPQVYEEMAQHIQQAMGVRLPRVVPFLRMPAFIYFRGNWNPQLQPVSYKCPLLWPLTLNAVDLDYSLRPFLKGVNGGSRGEPRPPKWADGHRAATAKFASVFVALAVILLPTWGIERGTRLTQRWAIGSPADVLLDGPWTTLQGNAMPYSLSIPELIQENNGFEYDFRSQDNLLFVTVHATAVPESVSNIGEARVQAYQTGNLTTEARLESTTSVKVDGVEWTEACLLYRRNSDGRLLREKTRACSDDRGAVSITTTEAADGDVSYAQVTEKILASVKLAPKPDPQDSLLNGPWITVRGSTIPYSLSVPECLVKVEESGGIEHAFNSPDRKLNANVLTMTTREDASGHTGEGLVQVLRDSRIYEEIRIESTNVMELDGVTWMETRLVSRMPDLPVLLRSKVLFHSDDRGTVIITTTEPAAGDVSYARVTEKILASVTLEKSDSIDSRLVGLWESTNAPVRITQEFTQEGESKISFSGTTVVGSYKLDGDNVDWRSGVMNVKAKVRFFSPTEMELSNEAGQTVRYRKQVEESDNGTSITLDGPTDLLKLIDLRRDVVAGKWKLEGGTLITGSLPHDRLDIPVEVPAEYRLTVVAQCASHREALQLGLVAGSRQVLAILDGWGKTSTCLHQIDRTDGVQFPHHRGPVLRDGVPNLIICEVRANHITLDCNGVRVIDWTGDFRRFSIDSDWKVRNDRHLFIGSWDTPFVISKLELSPL